MHQVMNTEQATAIHQALICVQSAVTEMTFPRCNQEDLIELIDRVEEQLHCSHPDTPQFPCAQFARSTGSARSLSHDRAGDRGGRDAEHLAVRYLSQASRSVRPAPDRQPLDQRHESVEIHRLRHV